MLPLHDLAVAHPNLLGAGDAPTDEPIIIGNVIIANPESAKKLAPQLRNFPSKMACAIHYALGLGDPMLTALARGDMRHHADMTNTMPLWNNESPLLQG